tara:strand:+ start:333 stop:638 length:306 start_codon:yes stop_codon:yes gene_type:complete
VGYRKLFNYLIAMGIGGLGLFNSSKLEIRYETNSNLELLCQNGMIISSVVIAYFFLAFWVEILTMRTIRKHRAIRKTFFADKEPLSISDFVETPTKRTEEE